MAPLETTVADLHSAPLGRAVTAPAGRIVGRRARSGPKTSIIHASYSPNWAGYLTKGKPGLFQGVYATWQVPYVQTPVTGEAVSSWIGIDGVKNADLIQTGTEEDGGTGGYYAWWEILPAVSVKIMLGNVPAPVEPDDVMTSYIKKEPHPGKWQVYLSDTTEGWTFQENMRYNGPADSAEWITEAPTTVENGAQTQSIPPDFGDMFFQDLVMNYGGTWYLTGLTAKNESIMVNRAGNTIDMQPTAVATQAVTNTQSFYVIWKASA